MHATTPRRSSGTQKWTVTQLSRLAAARVLAPWLMVPCRNAEAVYRAAASRYGQRISISWPAGWHIEFHPDPYRTARVRRRLPPVRLRAGWPSLHSPPRRARDCGEFDRLCAITHYPLPLIPYPLAFTPYSLSLTPYPLPLTRYPLSTTFHCRSSACPMHLDTLPIFNVPSITRNSLDPLFPYSPRHGDIFLLWRFSTVATGRVRLCSRHRD